MGFRDSNQDLLGFVHLVPERARERILDIAATQFPDGGAYHQYQPLTKRGNNDDRLRLQRRPAVADPRRRRLPQGDRRPRDPRRAGAVRQRRRARETPLYEHLQRSLDYTLDRLGPHGLPLIGRADWNDCLNLNCFSETPGESFQTTANRTAASPSRCSSPACSCSRRDELAAIAGLRGDDGEAARCASRGAAMTAAVVEHGWDGEWFLRAYDYFGNAGRLGRERRGPDLHRAAGHLRRWPASASRTGGPRHGARLGPRAARDAARHRAPPAGLHALPRRARRDLARTRPATRRTPASSATPTRG